MAYNVLFSGRTVVFSDMHTDNT